MSRPPLTGPDLARICRKAKPSSAGLDGWRPSELALVSDQGFHWLALLLRSVEGGIGPPPPSGSHRHAPEGGLGWGLPQALRLLAILPSVYRLWAATRLRQVSAWTRRWSLEEMYAGLPGRGASQAWFDTSLEVERFDMESTEWALGCVDCYKCFDQIVRPLLFRLLLEGGFPPRF